MALALLPGVVLLALSSASVGTGSPATAEAASAVSPAQGASGVGEAQVTSKAEHTCGSSSGHSGNGDLILTSVVVAREDLEGVYVQFEILSESRGISATVDSSSGTHLDLDKGEIGEFSVNIDSVLHPGSDWIVICTARANHPTIPFRDVDVSGEKRARFTVPPMTYDNPRAWLSSCSPTRDVQGLDPGESVSIHASGRAENDTPNEKGKYRLFGHVYKDGEKQDDYIWSRSPTSSNELLFEKSLKAPQSPGIYTVDCVLVTHKLNFDLLDRIQNVQSCQSGHYVPAVAACMASLSLGKRIVWRPVWIISFTICVGDETDCPGKSSGTGTPAPTTPTEPTSPQPVPVTPPPPPAPPPAPTGSGTDLRALIDLHEDTGGERWINNLQGNMPWNVDDPPSDLDDWFGIDVHSNGRVSRLDFRFYNNLHGTLPATLANLTQMRDLYIRNNPRSGRSQPGLHGEIPAGLGNLTGLWELDLAGNALSGEIPGTLGNLRELTFLDLSGNRLEGEIPGALGNLGELYALDLSDNRLEGNIPGALGNLDELEELYLSDNRLEGQIPPALGELEHLEDLYLSGEHNKFTGCIPSGLRSVRRNDLNGLGIPFCDVALSGLAVAPGQLEQPFDGSQTSFDATVYQSRVTITASLVEGGSYEILDDDDNPIADADTVASGYQVEPGVGYGKGQGQGCFLGRKTAEHLQPESHPLERPSTPGTHRPSDR